MPTQKAAHGDQMVMVLMVGGQYTDTGKVCPGDTPILPNHLFSESYLPEQFLKVTGSEQTPVGTV